MNIERHETESGIPVFTASLPLPVVAGGIFVKAGTRDESWPEEAGLAHALEHMCFRGNKKFPEQADISGHLEEVGGSINGFTSSELTCYYGMAGVNHLQRVMEYLYNLVNHPVCRNENAETEMQNILEEIKRANDSDARALFRILKNLLYGKIGHPIGYRTLGKSETVSSFRQGDFIQFHERLYHPANFALIFIGGAEPNEVVREANTHFQKSASREPNERNLIQNWEKQKSSKVEERDVEQAHLAIGALAEEATARSTIALQLFSTMIGGGMSFPLFQKIRTERGLCYSVSSYLVRGTDVSRFSAYIGTSVDNVEDALSLMLQIIEESKNNEELLNKAKDKLIGSTALKYSTFGKGMFGGFSRDILFEGRPQTPDRRIEEIKSVSIKEVEEAVNKFLQPDQFARAAIIPEGSEVNLE